MVTYNSTLLGTLPPTPTNGSLLFESEHPLIPPRCFSASTLEANGWFIQSNGCSIQSFNFMPRSPPCVCCFSSPPCYGWAFVGSGVSMGPLSADTQPPPSSADSAWFLTQNSGFVGHDGRTSKPSSPPKPPWFFEQETFDFCLSSPIPVLTTSTHVVAWPQGDRLLS